VNERGIQEGMAVYSSDGEKLGKVISLDADGFLIEKGFFFPKEYFARFAHVATVSGDEVRLSLAKDQLAMAGESDLGARERERRDADLRGAGGIGAAGLGGTGAMPHESGRGTDELRTTVAEEELDVVKRQREAGEVRLKKDVVTETKHIDVPVTREEVRVERTPIDAPRSARPGEAEFREETVSMPIREEEVEIRKRPVVKEEVRVKRDRTQQEQRADAEVRRETVDIEDDSGRTNRDVGTPGSGLGAPGRDDDLIR
jgi:uncharacterized protein (TIGR02271 family)